MTPPNSSQGGENEGSGATAEARQPAGGATPLSPQAVSAEGAHQAQHTPGPWRWELNLKSKQIDLCGGARPLYDLSVLRFTRWGMGGAAPMFINERGVMERADKLGSTVPGREHHASWFQGVNHPDARLIAAAPDLVEALEKIIAATHSADERSWLARHVNSIAFAALSKARSEQGA